MAKTSDQGEMRGKSICWVLSRFLSRMRRRLREDWGVLYPSINTFQQAYQSGNEQVRLKAVGLIAQVFEKADRSVSNLLYSRVGTENSSSFCMGRGEERGEQGDVGVYPRELESYQILVQLVDSSAKRTLETESSNAHVDCTCSHQTFGGAAFAGMPMTAHRKVLHDVSLQKLMKIGLQYREEFRALMGQCTEMRVKLETVIKNSKSLSGNNDENKTSSGNSTSNSSGGSIKLKTDFSNFTS
ncbi:HEAT repeat-containing protein 5B [Orchesella cincta]|uniref:HEAT repeat-containing protein 5B n=1 Tax=Orchesella cincta TaxID=48709 RepID=A0A1D2M402_ORCCI|nr:HEAT repeat-containing protein 5B [Orchesella cincta]